MTARNLRPVQPELTLDLGLGLDFDTDEVPVSEHIRRLVGDAPPPTEDAWNVVAVIIERMR